MLATVSAPDELSTRDAVLEESIYRAEEELRALSIALETLPRVDDHSGVITLASGSRMAAEEVGDAARLRGERSALLLALRRTRRTLAALRVQRRHIGERWPVGLTEIGEELGYPAATVKQWRNRGLLPAPAGNVSGAPFWWRRDIMAWARDCGRDRKVPALTLTDSNAYAMDGNRGAWDR